MATATKKNGKKNGKGKKQIVRVSYGLSIPMVKTPIVTMDFDAEVSGMIAKTAKTHEKTIKAIGSFIRLDGRDTASLSKEVYRIVKYCKDKGIRCEDGDKSKAVSILMVTSALLAMVETGKFVMSKITNADLQKIGDDRLNKFYQCVRERRSVVKNGTPKAVPAYKKNANWFLNADTENKNKFCKDVFGYEVETIIHALEQYKGKGKTKAKVIPLRSAQVATA